MKLYVTYEDEGPKGVCGQDTHTTSCWKNFMFFKELMKRLERNLNNLKVIFTSPNVNTSVRS